MSSAALPSTLLHSEPLHRLHSANQLRSVVIWRVRPHEEISETCVRLEEFTASAARDARSALRVIDRIWNLGNGDDQDLFAALKKYVEDACQAVKEVDNTLKVHGSSLGVLLHEIPYETKGGVGSWRNLIGRRDIIAHQLLTVDSGRVYREAVRDFGSLHKLLAKICFVPVKTNWASNKGFPELTIRADAFRGLTSSQAGDPPSLGASFIFVCLDEQEGFMAMRLGRTQDNKMLWASSHAPLNIHMSVHALMHERGDQPNAGGSRG